MGGLGRVLKFANDPWRVRWNPHEANEKVAAKRRERETSRKREERSRQSEAGNNQPGVVSP